MTLTSGPARPPAVVGRNSVRNPADVPPGTRPRSATATGAGQALVKAARAAAVAPLVLTEIYFTREMRGRFGTGKDSDKTENREADFFGDVQVHRARVSDGETILDPDKLPADAQSLTSQVLRVVSDPQPPRNDGTETPPRYFLRAWENAYATSEDKTIQADTITYDSAHDQFYAYGEDGRDVLIAQQDKVGQPSSVVQGRAARYNARSGQAELLEPKSVALVDARTGYRPEPENAPKDKTKIKRPERVKFRNPRSVIERKDFTGR